MNALAYHGNQSRDTVPRFELKDVVSAYETFAAAARTGAPKVALKRAAVESRPVRKELVGATIG